MASTDPRLRAAREAEPLEVLRGSPGAATWTRNSLQHRIMVAEATAARLRRSYTKDPYKSACEVLARLEDMAAAMCRGVLENLGDEPSTAEES